MSPAARPWPHVPGDVTGCMPLATCSWGAEAGTVLHAPLTLPGGLSAKPRGVRTHLGPESLTLTYTALLPSLRKRQTHQKKHGAVYFSKEQSCGREHENVSGFPCNRGVCTLKEQSCGCEHENVSSFLCNFWSTCGCPTNQHPRFPLDV